MDYAPIPQNSNLRFTVGVREGSVAVEPNDPPVIAHVFVNGQPDEDRKGIAIIEPQIDDAGDVVPGVFFGLIPCTDLDVGTHVSAMVETTTPNSETPVPTIFNGVVISNGLVGEGGGPVVVPPQPGYF